MAEYMIEREVVIDAPVEVVWRAITEPDQISQWFADRVELDAVPGGRGLMVFGDQGGPLVVQEVDRPTRFSFRWNHPQGEEPAAGNSLFVEFTLVSEGGEQTRLRVVESGLELLPWPAAEKDRYAEEHNSGWPTFMERLARMLAARETAVRTETDDGLWSAIADPSRRRVLDHLVRLGEASASSMARGVPFSRQAVSKHLVVLEHAGLIRRRKQGREVLFRVDADRLDEASRAMAELARQWDRRLDRVKRLAEAVHAESKERTKARKD